VSQRWILADGQSLLLTPIAATENVSSRARVRVTCLGKDTESETQLKPRERNYPAYVAIFYSTRAARDRICGLSSSLMSLACTASLQSIARLSGTMPEPNLQA